MTFSCLHYTASWWINTDWTLSSFILSNLESPCIQTFIISNHAFCTNIVYFRFCSHRLQFFLFWFSLSVMFLISLGWVNFMLSYLFVLISEIPRIRICFLAWWFPFEYYYSHSAVKHLTTAALILQLQNNSLCGSALNTLHHFSTV